MLCQSPNNSTTKSSHRLMLSRSAMTTRRNNSHCRTSNLLTLRAESRHFWNRLLVRPYGRICIIHLISSVTERYQPLPHYNQRARFLITVQVPILEAYHARIASSLDAFETLSSAFVRAVPGALAGQVGAGVDTRRLTSGHEGLQRLLKAYASACAMKGTMQGWGDSIVSETEFWLSVVLCFFVLVLLGTLDGNQRAVGATC